MSSIQPPFKKDPFCSNEELSSVEPSSRTSISNKWEGYVQKHTTKDVISTQIRMESDKLNDEHEKNVATVTKELRFDEADDVSHLMDAVWIHTFEQVKQDHSPRSKEISDAFLCVYITRTWIYIAAYTENLGYTNITVGNNNKPGFPAQLRLIDGRLEWSDDYNNLLKGGHGTGLRIEFLNSFIQSACRGVHGILEMITELFQRLKVFVEEDLVARFSQLMLITQSGHCSFLEQAFLRKSFESAGFPSIFMVSDASLAAHRMFSTIPSLPENADVFTLVVVNIDIWQGITFELFGCAMSGDKLDGVDLLAVAWSNGDSKEAVKYCSEVALSRVSTQRRNSIRHYMVVNPYNETTKESIVHDVLGNVLKLTKIETFTGENLKELMLASSKNLTKLRAPLDVLMSTITGISTRQDTGSSETRAIEDRETRGPANEGIAKLPLKISMPDGKIYKIMAYTNWRVLQLKKEFLRLNSEPQSGPLTLQYRNQMLTDNDAMLNVYNLQAYSIIQAKFAKDRSPEMPNLETLNISENINHSIKLIGNCVALQNGTELVEVKGIVKGSLVVARLDLDNLTVGEVGITCKINGFGDTIYVGVKFRKQLALGSKAVQIDHVKVVDGYCDKCKGRRSLFIPSTNIGKGQWFQIQ